MAQEETVRHEIPGEMLQTGIRRLEFAKDTAFQTELRRRVDELFRATGRRKRDCWQMYLKSAMILAVFGVS